MPTSEPSITIALPAWLSERIGHGGVFATDEQQVALAIDLSRENVRRGTGGPFGAALFAGDGTLLSAGVNLVVAARCSILHAEIVALVLGQQRLGRHDVGADGTHPAMLASSAEPCAMCIGAIAWSGISRLACGARDEDVRLIGFDEGAKPPDWKHELAARGVSVVADVLQADAVAVLDEYRHAGGPVYNPGRRSPS